jgi:hypothetical protein
MGQRRPHHDGWYGGRNVVAVPDVARERAVPIRCSVVLYDWTSLDKSPPFVRWSGLFAGVPSGALRSDVTRVVIQPKTGSFLLYAPGTVSPRSSFRSIQDPTGAGLTGLTGPTTTSPTDAPGSGPAGSSGPDPVVI